MFVLQKAKHHKRRGSCMLRSLLRDVFQVYCDSDPRLNIQLVTGPYLNKITATHKNPSAFLFPAPFNCPLCPFEILELEDSSIISRQILVWIPRTCSERLQTAESLEACAGGNIQRGVDLVGEREVIFLLAFAVPPCMEPVKTHFVAVSKLEKRKRTVCLLLPYPYHGK